MTAPKYIFLSLVLLSFALTQSTALAQCSAGDKQSLYQSFLDNRTNDQPKAYDAAKKYLECPASSDTEAEQKIVDYLKKFISAYDQGLRRLRFRELLYNETKYPEAYALAKEILDVAPDDFETLVHAGANGYLVEPLKDASLASQARDYASRALAELDAGKTLKNWSPLTPESAIAYNNYTLGTLTISSDPGSALNYLIKAALFDTALKKSPYIFAYIEGAYETGDYAKQSEVYRRDFGGKVQTPQSKLALANINQTVDRMIDGYARAVALAGDDPKFSKVKLEWTDSLRKWYAFRNNKSEAGLSELIATILAKPLPSPPTPLTSLPR